MILLNPNIVAFLAVIETNTVHGAATKLHLTQTAVTQRIKSLEKQLDTSLFIRTRKGMILTAEGENLYQYALASKQLSSEITTQLKDPSLKQEVRVTISAPSSIMSTRIIPAATPLMHHYPNLLLSFDIDNVETRHHKLKSGEIDFAVVHPEDIEAQMSSKPLKDEEYILVGPSAWKNRALASIIQQQRIIDFSKDDQETIRYLQHFELDHYKRPQRYFINDIHLLAQLIENELGYSVLTKELAAPYLKKKTICKLNKGQVYHHKLSLIWYRRMHPPQYFTDLLNMFY